MSILAEGGGRPGGVASGRRRCAGSRVFVAPVVIGGEDSIGSVGGASPRRLSGAIRLGPMSVERVGKDILIRAGESLIPIFRRGERMFTGIIEAIGTVEGIENRSWGRGVGDRGAVRSEALVRGESVAVIGSLPHGREAVGQDLSCGGLA